MHDLHVGVLIWLLVVLFGLLSAAPLLALSLGLVCAGWFLAPGLPQALSALLLVSTRALALPAHLLILLTILALGGFGALLERAATPWATRGEFQDAKWMWLSWTVTFFDPTLRLGLRAADSSVRQRLQLWLSSVVWLTLVPIGTVLSVFLSGLSAQGLAYLGRATLPGALLWAAVPWNFFGWVTLVMFLSMPHWGRARRRVISSPTVLSAEFAAELIPDVTPQGPVAHPATPLPPRAVNLWLPGLLYVVLLAIGLWSPWARALTLLPNDPDHQVTMALVLTLMITVIVYRLQGVRLAYLTHTFLLGCGRLLPTAMLLVLAWAFDYALVTLGLLRWLRLAAPAVPAGLWPPLLLLSSALLARGSASLLFPLAMLWPFGLVLAGSSGLPLPLSLAALLSGAAFGLCTGGTWPNDFLVEARSGLQAAQLRAPAMAAMAVTVLLLLLATHAL